MSKKILISAFIVLLFAFTLLAYSKVAYKDKSLFSNFGYSHKNVDIEVLETADLNSDTPRFKLHVQTHEKLKGTPYSLRLIDRKNGKQALELMLSQSTNATECASHEDMAETMQKWDSDWFTLPELKQVNFDYKPKLADEYTAVVLYEGREVAANDTFTSEEQISEVCYQIAKTIPMSPNPEDENLPEE
jgi:hypothetical protein